MVLAIKITHEIDGSLKFLGDPDFSHFGPFDDMSAAESLLVRRRWDKQTGSKNVWVALLGATRMIEARIIEVPPGFKSWADPRDLPGGKQVFN
jgi:hypothetical protein